MNGRRVLTWSGVGLIVVSLAAAMWWSRSPAGKIAMLFWNWSWVLLPVLAALRLVDRQRAGRQLVHTAPGRRQLSELLVAIVFGVSGGEHLLAALHPNGPHPGAAIARTGGWPGAGELALAAYFLLHWWDSRLDLCERGLWGKFGLVEWRQIERWEWEGKRGDTLAVKVRGRWVSRRYEILPEQKAAVEKVLAQHAVA